MSERLLFVPTWLISPRVCEEVTAIRHALDELRRIFEVDVFAWPSVRGGPDFPATWEGGVEAVEAALTPGCHLVVMAEAVQAMIAISRDENQVSTFVAEGMWTPPATLRALGLAEMAQAAVSSFRGRSHQWVRLYTQGAGEEEQRRYAELMDSELNWSYLAELAPSFMALDLVKERPEVTVPTLYLDPAVELVGLAGLDESFKRFVPHAEVDHLTLWPGQLHQRQTGNEFAGKVKSFISRHTAS